MGWFSCYGFFGFVQFLKQQMKKAFNIILVILLFAMLAAVRQYQDALFYDPLINFFKLSFASLPLPDLLAPKFYAHLTFRFFLNTLLSLGILWFLFKKWEIIKISALIYLLFFAALMGLMALTMHISDVGNYQFLFYVRRFIIQPLLVLLLIPAFYFIRR
jgi:exosortase F-associated protein